MNYPYYSGYQQPQFYQSPMPDQLAQLRGAQYQPQQFVQQPPQQAGGVHRGFDGDRPLSKILPGAPRVSQQPGHPCHRKYRQGVR